MKNSLLALQMCPSLPIGQYYWCFGARTASLIILELTVLINRAGLTVKEKSGKSKMNPNRRTKE
jgi:hypothetical protein